MKKPIIKLGLMAAAVVMFSTSSMAQNKGESVFTVDAGFSVTGGIIKALFNGDTHTDTAGAFTGNVQGGPGLILGYDYGVSKTFSIGAIVSTQGFNGDAHWTFIDENNQLQTDEFDFKLRRSTILLTPRFHFGNEKADLYSGLRFGMLFWKGDFNIADPDFDQFDAFNRVSRPVINATIIGGRIYATDHLAAHFELNLGAPNIFGLGLSYKL